MLELEKVRQVIKSLIDEIIEEDEELEEATTTNDVEGYMTPFAFGGGGKKSKKKRKEYSTSSTGYKIVKELSDDDIVKEEVFKIFRKKRNK